MEPLGALVFVVGGVTVIGAALLARRAMRHLAT